jgi:DNA-binding NarL/FixJ family response regulator
MSTGRPITVVVADDQDLARAGLVALLDSASDIAVVGSAGQGEEAVRLVRRVRPAVALVDVRMPVMDGIQAIARIRQDDACAATGLVVLTMFGLDEYVAGALRAGADAFLLKDAEPAELLRCVRLVARGDAVISPAVTRILIDGYLRSADVPPASRLPELTSRERDVLAGVCRGCSNREIAAQLHVGTATVKTYVSRLLDKFDTRSRVGLVIAAHERGWSAIG